MSNFSRIFDIAGSALSAQSMRLNTVASNMANADAVAGSADAAYKERMPVFQTTPMGGTDTAGVQVLGVVENNTAPEKRYEPGHPLVGDNHVTISAVSNRTSMRISSASSGWAAPLVT